MKPLTNINTPNMLTLFRLFLIPIFILVFFSSVPDSLFISICIFLLAGFTDILDGYIARRFNLVTKWGMVLDPLADKLMLLTVLTCLSIKGYVPFFISIIVILKELFMIISGMFLYKKDTVIPSNIFGKLSTVIFYLSIFCIYFYRDLGEILLGVAVISAFIALINYLVIYNRGKA
ncbi:CDP-diacylglycerol--glycerol-3-phosphate 3-phosphatidyltransferase [Clostridium oryzae]|uniref:CDP-diacylglycerol--glycerol-3-phosphate 3-phosphatidyltransferase n=1 Tax=Clostridium oryzae TaxID=1450648 RepID=A0A1V4IR38_9CLOT|nr:CDP-diacylglycerol--glycerol-3-phosphate 3-phosphatidyltransferase [Clostridium oryzae]OPJ62255.1 CDP-diacylglycerol--glycerol-3-phosphate 3-phosphatidyltransferase [Clostridium oryzae]